MNGKGTFKAEMAVVLRQGAGPDDRAEGRPGAIRKNEVVSPGSAACATVHLWLENGVEHEEDERLVVIRASFPSELPRSGSCLRMSVQGLDEDVCRVCRSEAVC
jgi:hypothetical protein